MTMKHDWKQVRLEFAPEFEGVLRTGRKCTTVRIGSISPNPEVGDELVAINTKTNEEIIRGQIVEIWVGPLLKLPLRWLQREGVQNYWELKEFLSRFYGHVSDDVQVTAIEWSPVVWRQNGEEQPIRGPEELEILLHNMRDFTTAAVVGPAITINIQATRDWRGRPAWRATYRLGGTERATIVRTWGLDEFVLWLWDVACLDASATQLDASNAHRLRSEPI